MEYIFLFKNEVIWNPANNSPDASGENDKLLIVRLIETAGGYSEEMLYSVKIPLQFVKLVLWSGIVQTELRTDSLLLKLNIPTFEILTLKIDMQK